MSLIRRFNRSDEIGVGGMGCPCCADARKRGGKKNRALGRLVKRQERRRVRREINAALRDHDDPGRYR